jgi:hypothetical protein
LEKRQRDQLRRQKRLNKEQRRAKRVAERANSTTARKDADLEGMVAGPQPGQMISPAATDAPLSPARSPKDL